MKILLCARGDYYRNFAGDFMQIIKTVEHLRKMQVTVDINQVNLWQYFT